MQKKTGESLGTGDINLAAAVMTMGVPPDPNPLRLIATDRGRDYIRFQLMPVSVDGRVPTMQYMRAWTAGEAFTKANKSNPFSKIMSFIVARPDDCRSYEAWIQHAASWLQISFDKAQKLMSGKSPVWVTEPDSEVAYILAFVRNKFDLVDLAKRFQSGGRIDNLMEHGKSIALIPDKAPVSIRRYLLSNIQ